MVHLSRAALTLFFEIKWRAAKNLSVGREFETPALNGPWCVNVGVEGVCALPQTGPLSRAGPCLPPSGSWRRALAGPRPPQGRKQVGEEGKNECDRPGVVVGARTQDVTQWVPG